MIFPLDFNETLVKIELLIAFSTKILVKNPTKHFFVLLRCVCIYLNLIKINFELKKQNMKNASFESILWISKQNQNQMNAFTWTGNMQIRQNAPFPYEPHRIALNGFLAQKLNEPTDLFQILANYESKDCLFTSPFLSFSSFFSLILFANYFLSFFCLSFLSQWEAIFLIQRLVGCNQFEKINLKSLFKPGWRLNGFKRELGFGLKSSSLGFNIWVYFWWSPGLRIVFETNSFNMISFRPMFDHVNAYKLHWPLPFSPNRLWEKKQQTVFGQIEQDWN